MLNDPITITNAVTLSDGGTKYLIGFDSIGNEFNILISQHVFTHNIDSNQIPGRLYLNNDHIQVRSNLENALINSLVNCIIKDESNEISFSKGLKEISNSKNLVEANKMGGTYAIAYVIKSMIDFVQSDKYVEISERYD